MIPLDFTTGFSLEMGLIQNPRELGSSGYSSGPRKLPPLSPALITPAYNLIMISSFQTFVSAQLEMLQEYFLDKVVLVGGSQGC